ncbi:MAG TPA: protein phosphatase 2C domain-containing protein [Opitutaceae bacterium]
MKIDAHGVTNVGLIRDHNEDSLLVDLDYGVFAVADGVGGMPGGDVASAAAVEAVREALKTEGVSALADLSKLAGLAHRAVRRAADDFPGEGIATTFTLACIADGMVRVVHIGDSFAMLVRDGQCRALTREHNVENERSDIQSLAPFPPRYRYALTRVLGQLEPLVADEFKEKLQPGDWLIVATDGLTDMVEFPSIATICSKANDVISAADQLLEAALASGGHDNITFVVIAVESV